MYSKINQMYSSIQSYFSFILKTVFIYICLFLGKVTCIDLKKNNDYYNYTEDLTEEFIKNSGYVVDDFESILINELHKCLCCSRAIKNNNKTYRFDDNSYCSEFCRNSSCDLSKYNL